MSAFDIWMIRSFADRAAAEPGGAGEGAGARAGTAEGRRVGAFVAGAAVLMVLRGGGPAGTLGAAGTGAFAAGLATLVTGAATSGRSTSMLAPPAFGFLSRAV